METETPQKKLSSGFGPGPALAKAREGLGLTHEEVAEHLRLAPRQVQALESDDYDHLPGPTYVRGYLRSYAELVGLASGPILEAFGHVPAASKAADLGSLAPKEEITSQHRHVRLATYFMVALIVALAVSWWQGRAPEPKLSLAPAPASVPSANTAALPVAPSEGLVAPKPAFTALSPQVPTVTPKPAHAGPVIPARSGVAAKTAPPATALKPLQVVVAMKSAAGAVSQRALLVLHTEQDSWVDVRDAQGNKLLYETVPAGRVVTLDGDAPLKVFLGNAAGVKVEFDGKPFDVSSYMHGQIARFTLGVARTH